MKPGPEDREFAREMYTVRIGFSVFLVVVIGLWLLVTALG